MFHHWHCPRRFAREPRWSETGDRYIIKLFRDYVFHQVDERGNPVVNLSHVLTCLNKVWYCCVCRPHCLTWLTPLQLDVGTDEKIMLVARDEQSCLIVSYKEIKHCIESAFGWVSYSLYLLWPAYASHLVTLRAPPLNVKQWHVTLYVALRFIKWVESEKDSENIMKNMTCCSKICDGLVMSSSPFWHYWRSLYEDRRMTLPWSVLITYATESILSLSCDHEFPINISCPPFFCLIRGLTIRCLFYIRLWRPATVPVHIHGTWIEFDSSWDVNRIKVLSYGIGDILGIVDWPRESELLRHI